MKPKGDAFAPRNPFALKIDYEAEPPMFNVGGQHRVCFLALRSAGTEGGDAGTAEAAHPKMKKEDQAI
jgi:oligopeptide transport system ATP-binding protein